MTEPAVIGSLLGMDIYGYGMITAASVLCGCLLCVWLAHARLKNAMVGLRLALYAVPLCLLFARLGYCLVRAPFIAVDYVPDFCLQLRLGGYSLAGGSLGLILAAWVAASLTKRPFAALMDLALPCAMVALAGLRWAEAFTLNGVGAYMDNEAFWWFPMAVQNTYGEFVLPVFFWEGLTALVIAVVVLARRFPRPGDRALTGALLLGLTQVFWESLRADDYLRFGFVRMNQLWGVAIAVFVIALWLSRRAKPRRHAVATVAAVALCVVGMVGIMFGLDKLPIPNEALYALLGLILILMGVLGLRLREPDRKGGTRRCA